MCRIRKSWPAYIMFVITMSTIAPATLAASTDGYYEPSESATMTLHEAISVGDFSRFRKLVNKGSDIIEKDSQGRTPLYIASKNGNVVAVRYLLENGVDPNIRNARSKRYDGPDLPLSVAAFESNENVVKLLLAAGGDPNAEDEAGTNALHYAALNASVKTIQLLLAAGAQVNAQSKYGATPLHYGALGDYYKSQIGRIGNAVLAALMSAGANAEARTGPFPVPVNDLRDYIEARLDKSSCIKQDYGYNMCWADVHIYLSGGNEPIHIASQNINMKNRIDEKIALSKVLLESGADRYARNDRGKTPYDLAWAGPIGDTELQEFLKGDKRSGGGSFNIAVAMSIATTLVANEAGLDSDAAIELGVKTARRVKSQGVKKGLLSATREFNQQLASRQAEIDETARTLNRKAGSRLERQQSDASREYRQAVARSRQFERCIEGGKTALYCSNLAKGKTSGQNITRRTKNKSQNSESNPALHANKNSDTGKPVTYKRTSESKPESRRNEKEYIEVKEALAVCWQNKGGHWWCSGPLQESMVSDKTEKKAISSMGCDNHRRRVEGVSIKKRTWNKSRSGVLYYCNRPPRDHDRDIREIFDFTMPPAIPVILYRCEKSSTSGYFASSCETGRL